MGGRDARRLPRNVVLAERGSATAAAAVAALANPSPGHTPFLVCHGPGNVVRPATIFVNKTTIDGDALGRLTWGAAQLGVGQGVLDVVAEGRLPADDVVVLAVVWIDPAAGDERALKRSARAAMRDAIARRARAGRLRRAHGAAGGGDERLL